MKKGRPGVSSASLATRPRRARSRHVMLRETTTLGVRRTRSAASSARAECVEVETPFGTIPVKIAEGPFGPPQIKPEFDACAAAARAHGVPVREVIAAALSAASNALTT